MTIDVTNRFNSDQNARLCRVQCRQCQRLKLSPDRPIDVRQVKAPSRQPLRPGPPFVRPSVRPCAAECDHICRLCLPRRQDGPGPRLSPRRHTGQTYRLFSARVLRPSIASPHSTERYSPAGNTARTAAAQ